MAGVSQETVLGFLLQAGGRVKNSELLSRFKPLLDSPDPDQRAANREQFKKLVNSLAVVKDEGDGKCVVLRKRYSHLLQVGGEEGARSPGEGPPIMMIPGEGARKPKEVTARGPEDRARSQRERVSNPAEGPQTTWPKGGTRSPEKEPETTARDPKERDPPQRCRGSRESHRSSQEGASPGGPSIALSGATRSVRNAGGERRLSLGALEERQSLQVCGSPRAKADSQPRRHSLDLLDQVTERTSLPLPGGHGEEENEGTGDHQCEGSSLLLGREPIEDPSQKSLSVFALVARIDDTGLAPNPQMFDAEAKKGHPKEPGQKPYMLPLRVPPPPIKITPDEEQLEISGGQGRAFLRDKEHFGSTLLPDTPLPKSPYTKRRQLEETGARSPHLKRVPKSLKVSEESKYSDTVPLESAEHDWLVKTTSGRWTHHLYGLLLNDTGLVEKKDFMCGFTALHWAAKSGNSEMLNTLIEFTKKGGTKVDVNTKSFGGYTPLHIATMHGREEVILRLVRNHGAKVNLRDWSGKKAHQYLHQGASHAVRFALGDPHLFNSGQGVPIRKSSKVASSILGSTTAFLGVLSDDMAFHDLTKGLKKPPSLNKLLFNAPAGPKKKPKARGSVTSFSSLHEDMEDEQEETTGKRRPKSEYYSQ